MTTDKAIRRLQAFVRWRKPDPKDNLIESAQLGIEALKHLQRQRQNLHSEGLYPLPGEDPQ